jgi:hypothetical protein
MLLATAVFPDVEAALAVNMSKEVGARVLAARYLAVTRHSFDKIWKAVRSRLVFQYDSFRAKRTTFTWKRMIISTNGPLTSTERIDITL